MPNFFLYLFLYFFLIISFNLKCQTRKYSNEFLNIGVGAKALSMGNANIVSSEGVYSGYWNPAGLLKQKNDLEISLMHAEYFAGIAKYDFMAITKKIDSNSVAGISILRFGVDNIPNTLDLIDANGNIDYNRISSFNAVDFATLISYSRKIQKLKQLDVGGNFKIIRRKIGEFGGAWGFGLDLGIKYNYKNFKFAAMARDVSGTFNVWSYSLSQKQITTLLQTGNQIPSQSLEITTPQLILGLAKSFLLWKDRISILGEFNLINTFDGKRNAVLQTTSWSLEPAFGTEIGYKNLIYLRAGFGNIQKQLNDRATYYETTVQPNFGIGIKYKLFTLDYALTNIGERTNSFFSNIFSVKIAIDKKN